MCRGPSESNALKRHWSPAAPGQSARRAASWSLDTHPSIHAIGMKPVQAGDRWPALRRPLLTASTGNSESAAGATAADLTTSEEGRREVDCFEPGGDVEGLVRQPTSCPDSETHLKSDLVWLHSQTS